MKVKVIAEDYKDVQVFKDMMEKESKRMISEIEEGFMTNQSNILKQIDNYLKGIALQLKDTKDGGWQFYASGGANESVRIHFRRGDSYYFRLMIGNGDLYICNIVNGDLIIDSKYDSVLSRKQNYIELIIKNWKNLKENIHKGIIEDLERTQKEVTNNLNKVMQRKAMFDDFEI